MDIDNENKSLQVNLYQERYLFKIHDTNLDDLSECVKQALGSKSRLGRQDLSPHSY